MIVEDGSGLANSNSYVDLEFADAYHTDRGNSAWTGDNAIKEAALIRATDYIDQVYGSRWIGNSLTEDQALAWPREEEGVPAKLKQAVCILALETIGGSNLNPVQGPAIKREKVDVIETEYMSSNEGGRTGTSRPAIDQLLFGLIKRGSMFNARVVRV